jgi:hypothetical protein
MRRHIQTLMLRIPPEMIAAEQKAISIQQDAMPTRMPRCGNDPKIRVNHLRVNALNHHFRIGLRP